MNIVISDPLWRLKLNYLLVKLKFDRVDVTNHSCRCLEKKKTIKQKESNKNEARTNLGHELTQLTEMYLPLSKLKQRIMKIAPLQNCSIKAIKLRIK